MTLDAARTADAGLFGKLPSRGDFVQLGLPGSFVRPWDAWLQQVMAGSQARMGDGWLDAFLESPVWRFALPGGMCGAGAVLGLLMPSVDRVGRYFPLTLAAVFPPGAALPAAEDAGRWLEACEAAGRAALDDDVPPDRVAEQVAGEVPRGLPTSGAGDPSAMPQSGAWWTDGGPRVAATRLMLAALPDLAQFAAMLGAGVPDEGMPDEGTLDEGTLDEGTLDGGTLDGGTLGAGVPDEGMPDEGTLDEGTLDGGMLDGGTLDGGTLGAGGLGADILGTGVLGSDGPAREEA